MLYPLLRPLLFKLDPETAHNLSLSSLDLAHRLHLMSFVAPKTIEAPITAMGLTFKNAVGLAAGLDKNGTHIDALFDLGFGFIEIGTVTPRPQTGNDRPRLFRLIEHQGIINRMGFNNLGVDALVERVRQRQNQGVLGINIGKNATTPIEHAADDYLICMEKVYEYASYITINISSPNTKNLRQLQQGNELAALLYALKTRQHMLADRHGRYVPLTVKIAPDLDDQQIADIAHLLIAHHIDGVIAGNTTLSRETVNGHPHATEAGGLSGRPLTEKASNLINKLSRNLDGSLPILGVGGILCGRDAVDKIAAGATLVQLYSGLVYQGPSLIESAAQAIAMRPPKRD